MERLQTIWEEAGRPGAAKFKAAALLEGVRVTRDQAQEFVNKTSYLSGVSEITAKLRSSHCYAGECIVAGGFDRLE